MMHITNVGRFLSCFPLLCTAIFCSYVGVRCSLSDNLSFGSVVCAHVGARRCQQPGSLDMVAALDNSFNWVNLKKRHDRRMQGCHEAGHVARIKHDFEKLQIR